MFIRWTGLGSGGGGGGGTADYPAVEDVRDGTTYAEGTMEGTLVVPAANQVQEDVEFDNGTLGTLKRVFEADMDATVEVENDLTVTVVNNDITVTVEE